MSNSFRRMATALITVLAGALSQPGFAVSRVPEGLWETVDDTSGEPRGLVRVYAEQGRYFGRIERVLTPGQGDLLCDRCTDERKDQAITGLVIMRDMIERDGSYGGGDILDPDTGAVYRCTFHLADDGARLIVRGYIGISWLGRTQIWHRIE